MSACHYRIQAVSFTFLSGTSRTLILITSDSAPEHWDYFTHPEGALYWVHKSDVSPSTRPRTPY